MRVWIHEAGLSASPVECADKSNELAASVAHSHSHYEQRQCTVLTDLALFDKSWKWDGLWCVVWVIRATYRGGKSALAIPKCLDLVIQAGHSVLTLKAMTSPFQLSFFGLALACSSWAAPPASVRFATFNTSLNRTDLGTPLLTALNAPTTGAGLAVKKVAEILQRVRPDVVLLNEFDFDETQPDEAARRFHDNYLGVSQNGQPILSFAHRYTAAPNTGYTSGLDLDNSGSVGATLGTDAYGNDCYGFGRWPGQYGMVVFSQYPISLAAIRSWRMFLWKDMPGAVLPDLASTPSVPADWYSSAELAVFRLSSKSHWDLPISFDGQIVHLLASHPTPPSFDASEDRNGRRNHDEIRLWADCIAPWRSSYLTDDSGRHGGLGEGERFVIAGDMNADPNDGDSYDQAIRQLMEHPLINASVAPTSLGGAQQSTLQGGNNRNHTGNPANDTSDFGDTGSNPGNLRTDYVLPSASGLRILGGGVFWPIQADPAYNLVTVSDHRLVYMDLQLTPVVNQAVRNLEIQKESGKILLNWVADAAYDYQIQAAESLDGPWQTVPNILVEIRPESYLATATDEFPPPGRRFYRISVQFH